MSDESEGFFPNLKRHLIGCGYRWRGGGIYTCGDGPYPTDWLSVVGNNYFCVVNAGVVFPDLSCEMVTLLPPPDGAVGLGEFDPKLLPFVFSPIQRYVSVPQWMRRTSADQVLTAADAEELAGVACGDLLKSMSKFHSMGKAIEEVKATLGVGSAKSFLLILAYAKQGQTEAARRIADKILTAMKTEAVRAHYVQFLRNVESKYGVILTLEP